MDPEATTVDVNQTATTSKKKNKYEQYSKEDLQRFLDENGEDIAPGKYRRIK